VQKRRRISKKLFGVRAYPKSFALRMSNHIGDQHAVAALPAVIEHHAKVFTQANNQFQGNPPYQMETFSIPIITCIAAKSNHF
jgi:hypothetical protein